MKNIKELVVEMPEFVSALQIAKRYSVTTRAVWKWADGGLIPSIRIGSKTRRFNLKAVIAALEGNK